MKSLELTAVFAMLLIITQGWCKPTTEQNKVEGDEDYPQDDEINADYDVKSTIISQNGVWNVMEGVDVFLPCEVENLEGNAITWAKDGSLLYMSDAFLPTIGKDRILKTENGLTIKNVTMNDTSTNYNCSVVANSKQSVVHSLIVNPRPPTEIPIQHVEVNSGEEVTLTCPIELPKIKWSKQGMRVMNGTEFRQSNENLTITKVNKNHAGTYQCLAEDSPEKPSTGSIELTVYYPPEIKTENEVVHMGISLRVELVCTVDALPPAQVTWLKQEALVPLQGNFKATSFETKHTLVITAVRDEDFGDYSCVAKNRLQNSSKTITLTGVPTTPVFKELKRGADNVTPILKWTFESYSPIKKYELRYRRVGDNNWTTKLPNVKSGVGNQFVVEYPLAGLPEGTYEADLVATNMIGSSLPSKAHTFIAEFEPESSTPAVDPKPSKNEIQQNKSPNAGSAAMATQAHLAITTLLLVVSSYVCTHL